ARVALSASGGLVIDEGQGERLTATQHVVAGDQQRRGIGHGEWTATGDCQNRPPFIGNGDHRRFLSVKLATSDRNSIGFGAVILLILSVLCLHRRQSRPGGPGRAIRSRRETPPAATTGSPLHRAQTAA